MSEPAQTEVAIKDFRGMASNVDPTDLQPGYSQIQFNVNGFQRGQLEVRRGLREVEFEAEE
jgi:hypothetical protein